MAMRLLVTRSLAVLIAGVAAGPVWAAGDPAAGEKVFIKCKACHQIGEGAKNMIGPELNGLDGRKVGSAPNYNYTEANKNSGVTWNEAEFKAYIENPKAKIPGTKMIFPGLPKPQDRDDLWAYVSQFGPDGKKK